MAWPTEFRSFIAICWRARVSGSRISTGATTCACAIVAAKRTIVARIAERPLFMCIHCPRWPIAWIGKSPCIGDQSAHFRGAESASISRHEGRPIERRTAMLDDGRKIGVTHLIERIAIVERMRLDRKVVVVGYALRGRLRVMTAGAMLIRQDGTQSFLVAKSGFNHGGGYGVRGGWCGCREFIAPRNRAQRQDAGRLPTGVSDQG